MSDHPDDRDNELKRLWAKAGLDEFACSACLTIRNLDMKCKKHSEEYQETLCSLCCPCLQCEACYKYFPEELLEQETLELICSDCWVEEESQYGKNR